MAMRPRSKTPGIASIVSYQDLNKDYLLNAINEVLDPKLQQHAKFMSRVWHDRPMSPMETAIYWTEYVARYSGTPSRATAVERVGFRCPRSLHYELRLTENRWRCVLLLHIELKQVRSVRSDDGRKEK